MNSDQLRVVPIDEVRISDDRRHDKRLDPALISSIREHGLLQPLVVQGDGAGRLEVLAGRRRLRHAKAAGLREVPVMVRGTSDGLERLMIEAEENAHRRDWTPIELADLCHELTRDHGWTQTQVGDWLSGLLSRHVSQSQVSQYLKLLGLTREAQQAVAEGRFGFTAARELARLNDEPQLQRKLVRDLLRELDSGMEVSTRALRHRVERQLVPAELQADERRERAGRRVGRVYEASHKSRVMSEGGSSGLSVPNGPTRVEPHDSRFTDPGARDPLVGLYLEQVAEGLAYLAAAEIPAGLAGQMEKVVRLAGAIHRESGNSEVAGGSSVVASEREIDGVGTERP